MDRQLLNTLFIILTLGVFFGFLAFVAESRNQVKNHSPRPPPSLFPRNSPPPLRRSPPHLPHPPPSTAPRKHSNLPPPLSDSSKTIPKNKRNNNNNNNPTNQNAHKISRPQPKNQRKLNFGKKIGLFFVGIGAILQVCVVSFLVIKRRQLFKA